MYQCQMQKGLSVKMGAELCLGSVVAGAYVGKMLLGTGGCVGAVKVITEMCVGAVVAHAEPCIVVTAVGAEGCISPVVQKAPKVFAIVEVLRKVVRLAAVCLSMAPLPIPTYSACCSPTSSLWPSQATHFQGCC